MPSTTDILTNADSGQWLSWLGIGSELVLASVCAACLCVIAYYSLARRDVVVPPVVWILAVYLAFSAMRHVVIVVFDQSPSGWSAIAESFAAAAALALLAVVLKLMPALDRLGVLAKMNLDLQRDVEQLHTTESTLRQRISELERINAELEYVSRGVVGREERILELKREINNLLQRMGEQPRYRAAMELQA